MNRPSEKSLKAIYNFQHLRTDNSIFDTKNTASIWQYYLLENLAVGLVRDSVDSAGSFGSAMAEFWQQKSPTDWQFKLKQKLKWSDGSPITPDQIINHFLDLRDNPARHTTLLKHLKGVEFDQSTNSLDLIFKVPVDQTILHELSLADAGLTKGGNYGWKITSGPYTVEEYDPSKKRMVLKRNPNCPIEAIDGAPDTVELIGLHTPEQNNDVFHTIDADFYIPPYAPYLSYLQTVQRSAPNTFFSAPNSIMYFHYRNSNSLAANLDARIEFQQILRDAFETKQLFERMSYFDQMIPSGFEGFIPKYKPNPVRVTVLSGKTITLDVYDFFRDLPGFEDALTTAGRQHNVKIILNFKKPGESDNPNAFAHYAMFSGNQRDPVGSWAFLFNEADGPLGKHADLISKADELDPKKVNYQEIHRYVLSRGLIAPFQIVAGRILYSNRIDLSRLNSFDLRARFYEVRWRN